LRNFALVAIVAKQPQILEIDECWSDMKFWLELSRKMGYDHFVPWRCEEEVLDYILEPSGITVKRLRDDEPGGVLYNTMKYKQYEQKGFGTPSGKAELYSQTLEKLGHAPLPTPCEPWESPITSPDLAKEYPLILTTGARIEAYLHSQLRDIPRLRERAPKPLAKIHTRTAEEYGIKNGDRIIVETRRGSIQIEASVREDIVPQVINIGHGWSEANANMLTGLGPGDAISGAPALKAMLCKIRKVSQ
jgi:anaerobic selenocysteine-containing dehydrogenase